MEKINLTPSSEEEGNNNIKTPEKIERVFLGRTKDGAAVYDRADSHFHGEGGLTMKLMEQALGAIDTGGRSFIKEQVNFDRPIGEKTCVSVGPEDEITMVYRKGRSGQTPMVKNREAEPCNSVIAILRKDSSVKDKSTYELLTGYIGDGSPREPWDPGITTDEERRECEDFWRTHAIIYDDDLIDWEKTKAFEFMTESQKEAELIRPRVLYAGIFLDPDDLYSKAQPTLEKPIKYPHVTTNFKPGSSQLYLDKIGEDAKIYGIGYGNDGKNEGLLVKIETDDPAMQEVYDNIKTPHITLSVSREGQPKDTAFLDFEPLETPIELTGEFGLFSQGKVVTEKEELAQ